MNFAFPSRLRIRQSKYFDQAFRQKGLINKWFIIYLVNSNFDFARLGLVVSKKTNPKSVNRNLAKRLIRELFRTNILNLPPMDFIVRIRRNLTKDKANEARDALLQLMLSAKTYD